MNIRRYKKIALWTGIFIVLILFIAVPVMPIHAQESATSNAGSGAGFFGGLLGGLGSVVPTGIWFVLLMILQMVLKAFLYIVSFFLDNVFFYNVFLNPLYMPAVQQGWSIMRDIANAVFILITLWVAFRIIFNIGADEMKKFLVVRVIPIALLINFSLAMVSVVFALANQLALPFRNAIVPSDSNDVAGIIINRVGLHTISNIPDPSAASGSSGAEQAGKDCGFNLLTSRREFGIGCVEDSSARQFSESLANGFWDGATMLNPFLSKVVPLTISVVFLTLAIATLLIAASSLLIRIVAMVMLSVLAPAAFIAYAIPTAGGKKIWDKWLTQLFCWAFYAPAFYFLFWLSLKILEAMTSGPMFAEAGKQNFAAFIFGQLPFVVFIFFLMASMRIGKMMSCEGATAAIDLGKKLTGFAVGAATKVGTAALTGGAGLAAGFAAKQATGALQPGGRISGAISRLSESKIPGVARLGGAAQGAQMEFVAEQRKKIDEHGKGLVPATDDQLRTAYLGGSSERKIAVMQEYANRGRLDKFEKDFGKEEVTTGLERATQYGMQYSILQSRPDLIKTDEDAKKYVPGAKNRKDAFDTILRETKDPSKIASAAYDDPVFLERALVNIKSPEQLKKLAQQSVDSYNKLMDKFVANTSQIKGAFEETRRRAGDSETKIQDRWTALQNSIDNAESTIYRQTQKAIEAKKQREKRLAELAQQQAQQPPNPGTNP